MSKSSDIDKPGDMGKRIETHAGPFGSCCKDLMSAMMDQPNPFFFIDNDGVLNMTVAYVPSEGQPGWVDRAVLFCPFCGAALQTREEVAGKMQGAKRLSA